MCKPSRSNCSCMLSASTMGNGVVARGPPQVSSHSHNILCFATLSTEFTEPRPNLDQIRTKPRPNPFYKPRPNPFYEPRPISFTNLDQISFTNLDQVSFTNCARHSKKKETRTKPRPSPFYKPRPNPFYEKRTISFTNLDQSVLPT